MFGFLSFFFKPNFGLIAVVGMLVFLFSGQLFPKSLDCQTLNCAKAAEIVKADQFWQQNKDKITTSLQKNFQPKDSQTTFSLPWNTEKNDLNGEKLYGENVKSENAKIDTGKETENIKQILEEKNIYEAKKADYHAKVLFLLESLNPEKQKKLCQLNFSFVSTSQEEAKIQAICQKVNAQTVQGIVSDKSVKSDIFAVPEEFLN